MDGVIRVRTSTYARQSPRGACGGALILKIGTLAGGADRSAFATLAYLMLGEEYNEELIPFDPIPRDPVGLL